MLMRIQRAIRYRRGQRRGDPSLAPLSRRRHPRATIFASGRPFIGNATRGE